MNLIKYLITISTLLIIFSCDLLASEQLFELRNNGTIPVWLVAGPFPNGGPSSDHKDNCLGYFRDYLETQGGEARANPVEGDFVSFDTETLSWKNAISDVNGLLNYIDIFGVDQQTPGVAYAFSKIYADQDHDIILKIRSDDGVKVWLNSKLIHDHHIGRGIEDEEDSVSARLIKGDNFLLVKVDQGNGGWALQLQVHKTGHQSLHGLKNKVTLLESFSGKIISADIVLNPSALKTDSGFRNELKLKVVSGGLKNVICKISKDEWPAPVIFNAGNLDVGSHELLVNVPQITKSGKVQIELTAASDHIAFTRELKKVKPWTVYLLPHSHVDIGYTHVQSYVEKYQWQHLENAIEYARRSEEYPAGSQFKWNTEVLWAVESYLKQASPEKKQQFFDAVKKGWVGLDGLFGNELTGLCRPEELMQFMHTAQRIGQEIGVPVEAAMISDVPGYTWSMVPVMAQNGIKYFSIGPNPGHRIGSTLKAWGDRPFYWVSPSGEEKILCWMSSRGYASFHTGLNLTENIRRINDAAIFDYLRELEANDFPYDITYLRYNIGSDNGPPDAMLAGFVKKWNAQYETPQLIIATTAEMFRAFESEYGESIPSVAGDFSPYWEDGAASSARETAINRDNAERLVQAEKIYAMLDPDNYPRGKFDDAWRNVLLYNEHTWGSWNSISEPEVDFTRQQWKIKQKFAFDADQQSRKLLQDAFSGFADKSKKVKTVQVVSTSSWPRTDLVTIPADWNVPGATVKDQFGEIILSQKLKDGSLAFLAENIPQMASAKYTIEKGSTGVNGNVSVAGNSVKNGFIKIDIDPENGTICSIQTIDGKRIIELVDTKNGNGLNEYFYVAGRDPSDPLPAGKPKITIKENGPLLASLVVESGAPGCKGLLREVRVISGINRVDIINTVDKTNIYEKESVHLAFPFNVPGGQMRVDIGWGHYRPEADQLPGACKNYLTVQRWVDISNQDYGVTWVTNDAPMIEVGEITADPVAYGWIDHLEPSQKIYSYVMNNYWETNYKASQEGPVTFRYSILPHGRFNSANAQRFGTERSQPLLVIPSNPKSNVIKTLFNVEPSTVVVTSVKPMEDSEALLVRLFNAGGRPESVQLNWGVGDTPDVYLSSPFGEKGIRLTGIIEFSAYSIKTFRVEQK